MGRAPSAVCSTAAHDGDAMSATTDTLLNERYRLDAEIGRGGMGIVYRGHDTLLKRDVAVKILSASNLSTESHARLVREAQATAQLNHPNIVSVYDAGEAELPGRAGSVPYIVMELGMAPRSTIAPLIAWS